MATTRAASDAPITAPISVDTITLTVHDIDAMADFYGGILGLAVHARDGDSAILGADRPLVHLQRDRAAPRRSPRDAGLFHTAFLVPDRADLGGWLRHFGERGLRLDGAADHGVSEALYLADPEGNGTRSTGTSRATAGPSSATRCRW